MTDELDLRATVEPPRDRWLGKLGLVAALIVLALAALVGAGWYITQHVLFPATDYGRCFIFDHDQCVEVSRKHIEAEAGVTLPEGSEITDSSASQSLKGGTKRVLIAFHSDVELGLEREYQPCTPDLSCLPRDVTDYLSERELVAEMSVVDRTGSTSRSIVTYAVGDDGSRWALVRVIWDG
jgi:hypothetical protein